MHAGASFVEDIDGLIGQEAVIDVLRRKFHASDQRLLTVPQLVVHLILPCKPAEDLNRLIHGGLRHGNRLEATLQRLVLLHILPVLLNGCRADDLKLAARQRWLHDVGSVHGATAATCAASAHQRVDLVNHEDDVPLRIQNLLDNVLQALLELATVLCACQETCKIELYNALPFQDVGNVARSDALGEALSNGRLSDTRLADKHRIVLLPPRQNLDGALQLLSPADKGVHCAFCSGLSEIAAVLLEWAGLRAAGRISPRGHAHKLLIVLLPKLFLDLLGHLLGVDVQLFPNLRHTFAVLLDQSQEDVHRVDGVGVELTGLLGTVHEGALSCGGERNLHRDHAGPAPDDILDCLPRLLQVQAELPQHRCCDAGIFGQDTDEKHLDADIVVAQAP
mmetsp:Transcript_90457/g.193984  ORF Transcript_90457/g.193984 Transcript_90457/m.193984 type:complete len:393 (-) Transcript_90457:756-1934(-)